MAKIIGNTVGTPIKPQVLVEKTELAEQVAKNTDAIKDLNILNIQHEIYNFIVRKQRKGPLQLLHPLHPHKSVIV